MMLRVLLICLVVSSCKDRQSELSFTGDGQEVSYTSEVPTPLSVYADKSTAGRRSPLVYEDEKSLRLDSMMHYLLCTAEGKRVNKLDDFINLLPNYMFYNFSAMHKSDSLCSHEINSDIPRIILSDVKTGLVIAHTGKKGGDCENTLEVMQVTDLAMNLDDEGRGFSVKPQLQQKYTFFEVSFGADGPHVSEPNPNVCTGCHDQADGKGALAIWKVNDPELHQPFWPGAYFNLPFSRHGRNIKERVAFAKKKKGTARYRRIPLIQKDFDIAQFEFPASHEPFENLKKLDDLFRPKQRGFILPLEVKARESGAHPGGVDVNPGPKSLPPGMGKRHPFTCPQ